MTAPSDADQAGLASVSYDQIPYLPRRWLWHGYVPYANPVVFAAAGQTGKGMLFCTVAARVVLGLPFPGEDQGARHEPGRVLWIAGAEDDQFEDLAPRLQAAIAGAVEDFGLAPELAGNIRYVHDLSEWRDGSAFELPGDMGRLYAETQALNELDSANRVPADPGYAGPGPRVRLAVLDPLMDLLGEHDTVATIKGARKTLRPVKLYARKADVAVVLIHHLTKDGKVAGSPAVLDALRLAFVVETRTDAPDVRVITARKANIGSGDPQQFTIRGGADLTRRAVFLSADGERAERVKAAQERAGDLARGTSVRDRIQAASGAPAASGGDYSASAAGRFKLLRAVLSEDSGPGATEAPRVLGSEHAARAAAELDAGRPLTWKPAGANPARLTAAFKEGGEVRSYAVYPA